jgi:AhpD family alkylhydroperoxidase
MSRVALVGADQAPLLARRYYPEEGPASPIVRALAHVPELLEVAMPFIARVFGPTSVSLRTKEIVVLRVSALNGCRYCVDTHTVAAWDAGLTQTETAALRGTAAGFPATEEALVAFCDAFCNAPAPVPDDVARRLRTHFAEHEIVELSLLAGATAMLNRFCTTLELPTTPTTRGRLEAAA